MQADCNIYSSLARPCGSFEHSHSQVMTSQRKLTCDHLCSRLIRHLLLIPEPTARSAVPGVSPGRGLLIPLLGEFKVDDGDGIFSVVVLTDLNIWRTIMNG